VPPYSSPAVRQQPPVSVLLGDGVPDPLGPLEVSNDTSVIALGGLLPRALLAMLLLHATQPVPVGHVAAALWGAERPLDRADVAGVPLAPAEGARRARSAGDRAGGLSLARAGELDAERFRASSCRGLRRVDGGTPRARRVAAAGRIVVVAWAGARRAGLSVVGTGRGRAPGATEFRDRVWRRERSVV
jgi:hypothetical protein